MDCHDVARNKVTRELQDPPQPPSKKSKSSVIPSLKELVHRLLSSLSFEALSTSLRHVPAPIYYKVLPNEFTVCFHHRKKENSDVPLASIRLVVKTGFIAENLPEEANISHFTEHAVFHGTTRYTQEDIKAHFESLGCDFGGDANAFTSYEETVYVLNRVPTTDKDKILKSLHMMYELGCQATFPSDLVQNESKVVEQELLEARGLSNRKRKFRLQNVLPNEQYLEHIGDVLVKSEDYVPKLKAFYDKWYRPHNMALIVVGDFGSVEFQGDVIGYIESLFSRIPTSEQKGIPKARLSFEPVQRLERTRHSDFHHKELRATKLQVWNPLEESDLYPNTPPTNQPAASHQWNFVDQAQEVIRDCALNIIDYRFIRDTEDPNGPIESINIKTNYWTPYNKRRFMSLSIHVRDERVTEAYQRCLVNLQYLVHASPRASHVVAAKSIEKKEYQDNIVCYGQLDHECYADKYVERFTACQPFSSSLASWIAMSYLCDKITQGHLKEALKEWNIFSSNGRTVSAFVQSPKTKQGIAGQLEQVFQLTRNARLNPDIEMEDSLGWVREVLSPCPFQSRQTLDLVNHTYDYGIEIESIRFGNGINVILAPTRDKDTDIDIQFILPCGRAHLSLVESINADIAIRTLQGIGFKNSPLSDIIPFLQASGFDRGLFSMNATVTTVEMSHVNEAQLALALKILHAQLSWILEMPLSSFKEMFNRTAKTRYEQIVNDMETADGYFQYFRKKKLYGVLAPLFRTEAADLRLANPETGYKVLQKMFRDLSKATLLISGNFRKENTVGLLQTSIGHLKSTASRKTLTTPTFKFPAKVEITQGERLPVSDIDNLSTTIMYFPVRTWTSREEQLRYRFASLVLGKYLMDKIRFEDQETYSLLGEMVRSELENGDNLLMLMFSSRTDVHAQLKKHILEAVDALSKESPVVLEEYTNFIREKLKKERNDEKRQTSFWTSQLGIYITENIDLALIPKEPFWVDNMTTNVVRAILAEVCTLQNKPFVETTQHPEQK